MILYLLALCIGVVAGMRAMTAPAAISWAAHLGWLPLQSTWLAFLGYAWTPWIFTLSAVLELVSDQLPSTPSRTVPLQFGTRLASGALSGAAVGAAGGSLLMGGIGGVIGAVVGTFGGRALSSRLASYFGSDTPAALIEDAIAITAAFGIAQAAAG